MFDTKLHSVPFSRTRILVACTLLALAGFSMAPAQASQDRPVAPQQAEAPAAVSAEEQKAVVDQIATLLAERYVFEDKGRAAGAHIQKLLTDGALAEATDPADFATELTKQLQSITHDKHMRVRAMGGGPMTMNPGGAPSGDPGQRLLDLPLQRPEDNFGFEKVQSLEGNIGYLKLNYFDGNPAARPTASAAMNLLSGCDALIVDLRENGGGSPEMIQWISSYLFDEPTHLNSLYWRQGDRTQEFWTHSDVPGARLGGDVPLFVLTSGRTFSGAEEFSYNIQTQKRGTLIGETTGGGANPGGVSRVGERFAIFIPTGRAVNPITKTNWEGVGVKPEIEVSAADAYDKALEIAGEAAKQRREQRQAHGMELRQAVVAALRETADSDKAQEAALASERIAIEPELKAALDRAVAEGALAEMAINLGGYGYMEAGKLGPALALFGYNAQRFAESPNVHDSLGEALEKSGRLTEAQASYRKALDLGVANNESDAQTYKHNLERVTAALAAKKP